MKRVLLTVLSFLLACCFLFISCTGQKPSGTEASPQPASASGMPEAEQTDAGPTASPAVPVDTSYDPETDANNLYSAANACLIETEDGFYWASCSNDYLLFYDNALEEMIPVCGRPECEHFPDNNVAVQNKNCDAYLEAWRHPALYQGKIYYIDMKGAPNPNDGGATLGMRLMRMDPDGTEKEFIKDLFVPDHENPQWLILHRGYIYGMSPETIVDHGEIVGRTSIISVPLEGEETTFKTIYSIENTGWGTMRFIGDYCYFWIRYDEGYYYINWDTGEEIDEQQSGGVAGRWNSKTEELEILYQELLPKDEYFFQNAWVERDGTFYVIGSQGLMKIENGERSVIQSFEDPDREFFVTDISNGIVIAHTVPESFKDPYLDWDFWICRFDGSTVFKGTLPMDWYRESQEFTELPGKPNFPGIVMIVGDEKGIWCEFGAGWEGPGDSGASADYLVRFDFTEDGIQTKVYGSFVEKWKNN